MKNLIAFLTLSFLFLTACENEDRNARLEVRLTDAPGDYDKVNIDIQGIEINAEEGNSNSGWKSLAVNKGVYNLLELTNGVDTLLSSTELPAGKISQIRLILGDNNSITIGGDDFDLTTPSAQLSGLKLNVHAELAEGIIYTILLDFDAAKSVVESGNGKYHLKPVIRSIAEAQSGAIKGTIKPVESAPAVFAILGDDTVATSYADETGKFLLKGVLPGVYTISFDPKDGYAPYQKTNVSVTLGNVTDLGEITIQ